MSRNIVFHGAKNPHILKISRRLDLLEQVLCFTDNNQAIAEFAGFKVYTPERLTMLYQVSDLRVCNLVTGSTLARDSVYFQLKSLNFKFISLIDPSVDTALVDIGDCCYVQENVSLQAGVCLRDNVSIHAGSVIGHETIIGRSSFVAHGCSVSGEIEMGERVFIGAGVTIHPRLKIGRGSIIGAGSVVTKHVPEFEIWAGNPAKRIKSVSPANINL